MFYLFATPYITFYCKLSKYVLYILIIYCSWVVLHQKLKKSQLTKHHPHLSGVRSPHLPNHGNLTIQGIIHFKFDIVCLVLILKIHWYLFSCSLNRTKKRSGSRNSARSAPISVETVLETTLADSPERVPKLEPIDHDLEMDGDATPNLLDVVDEDSNTALFLGPVMEMKISHDRVSAADTGQSNGKWSCLTCRN